MTLAPNCFSSTSQLQVDSVDTVRSFRCPSETAKGRRTLQETGHLPLVMVQLQAFHFQQDANLRGGPSVMANQWPNLTGWGNAIGTQTWLRITPYHLLWFRVAETRGHFYFPSLGAKFGIRNQPSTVGLIAQRGAAHSVRCTKGLDAPERGSLELNLKQMTSAAGFRRFEDVAFVGSEYLNFCCGFCWLM